MFSMQDCNLEGVAPLLQPQQPYKAFEDASHEREQWNCSPKTLRDSQGTHFIYAERLSGSQFYFWYLDLQHVPHVFAEYRIIYSKMYLSSSCTTAFNCLKSGFEGNCS